MNLAQADWLILLLYCILVVGIGYALRSSVKTGKDFFQAGRRLPEWVCALAFLGASLGAPEVMGMGAAGAKYGLRIALFCGIGATPAMIFAGLFMMPLYYGSKARSVPDFLGLRFDSKTRTLNACLFASDDRLRLRHFDGCDGAGHQGAASFRRHLPRAGLAQGEHLRGNRASSAVVVLAYVLLSGLAGAMVNQAVQFFLLVAGFLPMVLIGLRNIGGWSGLMASLPGASLALPAGAVHAGVTEAGLGIGLGVVLGAAFWCADFRVLQGAMAAKSPDSARRVPMLAAIPKIFLPFLLVLPGMVAIGLPTPRTTTFTRFEGGAILHTTTVVRPEVEAGDGLVPARVDAATGKPMTTASGSPVLDYEMATPSLLAHFLPTGVLGLGLTALLARLMSGLAANLTAFSTVFTCDLYLPCMRKDASEPQAVTEVRWAAVGGILLSVGTAFAVVRLDGLLDARCWSSRLPACHCLPPYCWACSGSGRPATAHLRGCYQVLAWRCCTMALRCPQARSRGFTADGLAVPRVSTLSGMAQSFCTAVLALSAACS